MKSDPRHVCMRTDFGTCDADCEGDARIITVVPVAVITAQHPGQFLRSCCPS